MRSSVVVVFCAAVSVVLVACGGAVDEGRDGTGGKGGATGSTGGTSGNHAGYARL